MKLEGYYDEKENAYYTNDMTHADKTKQCFRVVCYFTENFGHTVNNTSLEDKQINASKGVFKITSETINNYHSDDYYFVQEIIESKNLSPRCKSFYDERTNNRGYHILISKFLKKVEIPLKYIKDIAKMKITIFLHQTLTLSLHMII